MTTERIDQDYRPSLATLPGTDDLEARRRWLSDACGPADAAAARIMLEEWSIESPDAEAGVLGLRVFSSHGPGPRPALVYCHGGGFAINDLTINDRICRDFAAAVGCTVIAVDYRLSPTDRHPAAFEDCWAALLWTVEYAELLNIDVDRVAVGGASAGGALAAALAIAARDRGGPAIRLLHLVNPILDDRMDSHSATEFTDTPLLNRDAVASTWARYLPAGGSEPDVLACPGRLEDFAGMPPTYVEVAQRDPLRDEGLTFARNLLEADVPVEIHLHAGTFHGAELLKDPEISVQGRQIRSGALRRAFRT